MVAELIMETDISRYLTNYSIEEKIGLFPSPSAPKTEIQSFDVDGKKIPRYVGEFWTSKQRQASSIHEISYRACFKPQLPRFFVELLTKEKDVVYDPFSGRGTTALEAGLLKRNVIANDINPLSRILTEPRFLAPSVDELRQRLLSLRTRKKLKAEIDLSMFYHMDTEAEIVSLRAYLKKKSENGAEDSVDRWIRMVATNRLTGHSKGFFSVYTLPPNQAVGPESQIKINKRLRQKPEYRDTRSIILKKTKDLLRNLTQEQIQNLKTSSSKAAFLTVDARKAEIEPNTIQLTVTSPPFLDVVDYHKDNWLRCWFNSIDDREVLKKITMSKTLNHWTAVMAEVFQELYRITRIGGWVAFEVGEIRNGTIRLDEHVVPLGIQAGFRCEGILVNSQQFTKTSNIWGIKNNKRGTNTNRIVLFHKSK